MDSYIIEVDGERLGTFAYSGRAVVVKAAAMLAVATREVVISDASFVLVKFTRTSQRWVRDTNTTQMNNHPRLRYWIGRLWNPRKHELRTAEAQPGAPVVAAVCHRCWAPSKSFLRGRITCRACRCKILRNEGKDGIRNLPEG